MSFFGHVLSVITKPVLRLMERMGVSRKRQIQIILALVVLIVVGGALLVNKFWADELNGSRAALTSRNLIDSTGEIYGTKQISVTLDSKKPTLIPPENHAQSLIAEGSGENKFLVQPNLDSGIYSGADAEGVIVTLKSDSELVDRAKKIKDGMSPHDADEMVKTRHNELVVQHDKAKKDFSKVLGKKLISYNPKKPNKDQIRFIEHTSSINAITLYDVSVEETQIALASNPDVLRVEPNSKVEAALLDSVSMVNADKLWPIVSSSGVPLDGTGMNIGIIDTGVDYTNPDLGGCIGINCKVVGGYDFANNDSDPMDDHGHGTHVAATAAGNGHYTDSTGTHPLFGVAPEANLYAYKVLNASGSGSSDVIISAIERCADPNNDGDYSDRLDICSMSLGGWGNPDDSMSLAVDNTTANGVVFTIAAGNSGPAAETINSPGTSRSAITVAAACKTKDIGNNNNCNSAIANFSSRGPVKWTDTGGQSQTIMKPDISAPGVNICAALWDSWRPNTCLDSKHIAISGTSMATPHVAGVVALLRQAHPELTPVEIKDMLKKTAKTFGLDETVQGTGLVDAYGAVQMAGIPNSFLRISGLPISFLDNPTTVTATFTKTINVTNIYTDTLVFTPSLVNTPAGLSVKFDKPNISLAKGASADLTITLTVDHSVVASSTNLNPLLRLSTAQGDADIGINIVVTNRLSVNPTSVFLGVDNPTTPSYSNSKAITLTSTMTDSATTYTAKWDGLPAGVTGTLDKTSITLDPSANGTITLNLTVDNDILLNGTVNSTLTINSPLQSVVLKVYFYKGYAIKLNYNGQGPTAGIYFNSNYRSYFSVPSSPTSTSDTFVFWNPGPYSVEGQWYGDLKPVMSSLVLRTDIQTGSNVAEVSMSVADANHTVSLNPTTVSGDTIPIPGIAIFGTLYKPTGALLSLGAFNPWSGVHTFKTNDIPAGSNDYSAYAYINAKDDDSALYTYDYQYLDGVTSDVVLDSQPSQMVKKNLIGYQNKMYDQPVSARVYSGMPYYLMNSANNMFYSLKMRMGLNASNNQAISLPAGQTKPLYVYTKNPRDITTALYPDFPIYQVQLFPTNSFFDTLYDSPAYYTTPTNTYSFKGELHRALAPVLLGSTYSVFGVDSPPASIIPLGNSPLYDNSRWVNYANADNVLFSGSSDQIPFHIWGGYSDEASTKSSITDQTSTYTLNKDGTQIASGTIGYSNPGTSSFRLPADATGKVPAGNYQLTLSRRSPVNGVETTTSTTTTFKVVSEATHLATPTDENPPMLSDVHLNGNGLWQNLIDQSITNSLTFAIDPVGGSLALDPRVINQNNRYYTKMADSVNSVTLEQSIDNTTFTPVATTDLGGGYYNGAIKISDGATLYTFRVKAKDAAGNSLMQTFQVPTGIATQMPGNDIQAPTVSITNPTNNQTVSGTVAINANATDNASVARVDFLIDSTLISSDTSSPYSASWDSTKVANGAHALTAKAYDTSGNMAANSISVTVSNANPDTQAPATSITSPANYATVSGLTDVTASATDNVGVTKVELYLDGNLTGTDTTSPYTYGWDTTTVGNGSHSLQTKAYDAVGNVGNSGTITVQVNNGDTQSPFVSITAPTSGQIVAGTVNVSADATDNIGVTRVNFLADGTLIYSDTTSPYSASWDSTKVANGVHILTARAYDAAGNSSTSAPAQVTVNNSNQDTIAPTVIITAPSSGSIVARKSSVNISADASDNIGVVRVEFYVNARLISSDTTSPFSATWSVPAAKRNYTIAVKAYDAAGNVGSVSVTIRAQ